MTASTPGSYLTEQVGQGIVRPARVATFEERRETEDMPEELEVGKVGVAVELNKNNNEEKNRDQYRLRKEKVMKVGFAVQTNEGIESKVYDHFGSAPAFIIVDTEGKEVLTVNNKDLHHVHGACNPIMALDGKAVNAMIVGGIGAGALTKLNALGIKVYGAGASTVKENLSLLSEDKLQELSVYNSCRSHQGGCGH